MKENSTLSLFSEDPAEEHASLIKKFGWSPFTVLNAMQGDWQARKKYLISKGLKSELGRSAKSYNIHEWSEDKVGGQRASGDGTSIFDPFLCELIYKWFSAPGQRILDPFAGGSVRGIVAGWNEREYWGIDLREEQIAANKDQAANIKGLKIHPKWECGCSLSVLSNPISTAGYDADFVFSCPPYGDLEVYSDNPDDLSNMEYHTFKAAYGRIILKTVKLLKQDRFACFVVGDFRDKKGFYRNFVSDTISAFENAGARLYNEAIFCTPNGSACMRASKQFTVSRKLAKTHQNVLVFCKGDPRRATEALG